MKKFLKMNVNSVDFNIIKLKKLKKFYQFVIITFAQIVGFKVMKVKNSFHAKFVTSKLTLNLIYQKVVLMNNYLKMSRLNNNL